MNEFRPTMMGVALTVCVVHICVVGCSGSAGEPRQEAVVAAPDSRAIYPTDPLRALSSNELRLDVAIVSWSGSDFVARIEVFNGDSKVQGVPPIQLQDYRLFVTDGKEQHEVLDGPPIDYPLVTEKDLVQLKPRNGLVGYYEAPIKYLKDGDRIQVRAEVNWKRTDGSLQLFALESGWVEFKE
ncbi:MAG: hypothetical protein WD716_05320 [Fimbriimonadaceae bacterium]